MPMTASLLRENSRKASRQPLWTAPISPPSGARSMSSGLSEVAMLATTVSRSSERRQESLIRGSATVRAMSATKLPATVRKAPTRV